MDYSQPPAMGTDDDVYSFLDRSEAAPPLVAAIAPVGAVAFNPITCTADAIPPTPVIPIKVAGPSRPAAATMLGSPASSDHGGIRTRPSSI
jgi:hypothetical protein